MVQGVQYLLCGLIVILVQIFLMVFLTAFLVGTTRLQHMQLMKKAEAFVISQVGEMTVILRQQPLKKKAEALLQMTVQMLQRHLVKAAAILILTME